MKLINHSIKTDKWHMQDIFMEFKIDNIKFEEYPIFYHNIIKFLQFFIRYN